MKPTTSAGLIMAIVSFLASLTLGILFPICGPFCGAIWGGIAGVLAIMRQPDKESIGSPAREGATAGAIAGVGALAGIMVGMIISFGLLGGIDSATALYEEFSREFGVPVSQGDVLVAQQWLGAISMGCCLGVFGIAVQAGAGALGAQIFARQGANT